jgi:16S rRNA (guanine966-N2)-methyltransferase
MRIIAGQRRGHKIDGPRASAKTRPTSDLVRESLFNILGELVVDRLFIDLFAGTGSVGLEALSRGALQAIFVERDRENVAIIYRNMATLRYEGRAQVRHADAYRWMRAFVPADARPVVVFLDPPYRDYELRAKWLNPLIAGLVETLAPGSAVALEAGRLLDGRILAEYESWDIRRYGNTRVAIKVVPEREDGARAQGEASLVPPGAVGDQPKAEDRHDE